MAKIPEDAGNVTKLKELNEELENYFNNTIIPQLFVDADMVLRKFTPAAMTHFRLSDSDVGRHIEEVSHNIRFPTIIENIREVIESNESLEKEIQTTDKVWYQMNILPYIVRRENRANGVIITFVDINDRIQILKGYERLNRNHEVVIHALYHDIKGPVSNIEALVKIVEEIMTEKTSTDEDARSVLEQLTLSVAKLRETVEDLVDIGETELDFAKAPERVNFGNVIEDATLSLKEKITETNARVTSDINEVEIGISRKTIRSIIYNLVSNAIKYKSSDRAPEIRIRTERTDGTVLLTVSDNGLGIEEGKKEAIFTRYTRLRDDVEGTGIGLFIVKNMVEDTGGRIEVDSTVGEGSTFRVYFRQDHTLG
ncbi:sensor histidine kinase [Rufibacter latericius]|uniref:histidine kinase n=1 Tax=Rufibacter latericius TaxID=2487040 RepID=A0A3M9MF41_9BACT|nr:ATP-binding protein [Rufibacter latericius]RNI24179.1 GHKL domain-containing protein [Rufibacter latericius]